MADEEPRPQRRIKRREDREAVVARQREQFRRRQRNKRIFNYALLCVLAAAIAYAIYVYAAPGSGRHDALAKCLSQKGAVMYGTEWCPHCQEQKRLFGESFRHVAYVNCDLNDSACRAAGVGEYPTWVFPDGTSAGTQDLAALASRVGCTP